MRRKKIKAVMMAGGFGTRIQPLTHSIPKPMVPVVNFPMMEHTLKRLKHIGIDEVVMLLYYKPDVIKDYFEDGARWGVKIHYVLPDGDYGTAGAVGWARELLDTTFIVVSGDVVSDFDLQAIIDYHKMKRARLTITLTSVENPLQFGIVIVNEEGKIEKFLEKPSWAEVFSDTINTGIYVIEPEILDFIPKNEPFDFSKDLFPLLMEKGIDLYGYEAKGYWRDVGNPDSYREVHKDIFDRKVRLEIPGKRVEFPDGTLYLTGKSEIPQDVEIIDTVVIGSGVTIGKGTRLHNVVIGDNVTIGKECRLRNSVLWHDIKMGKKCVFDNAVICNDNTIADMVTAKAGLILAEGCKVGKLAVFEQDVTIWPDKEIEPAAVVTNNVVWGTKYKNAIFNHGAIVGKANVEISCDMACKVGEAFGTQLPIGSKVVIGRDYEPAPRMIKRAFAGGLLSTGIEIVDLKAIPPSVLRTSILDNDEVVGGAYFRTSMVDPSAVEIMIFNEEGLRLNTETSKSIEKTYFKENFRRVDYKSIGTLDERTIHYDNAKQHYIQKIQRLIDHKIIKGSAFRVAIDLLWGMGKDLYPDILKFLEIENILLNAYYDPVRLANLNHFEKESQHNLSTMVRCLKLNAGFLIYPQGQRIGIVSDDGQVLDKIEALVLVLCLLNIEAKAQKRKFKVFLPSWAPDLMDRRFDHLHIKRGKYFNFKAHTFGNYDLIATIDGNFAFTEFALHRDAIYASLKIMELLSKHDLKISEVEKRVEHFFYGVYHLGCPQYKKGQLMRKFIAFAKDRRHATSEGVKIYESDDEWVMMIPDQYSECINIFIQAEDEERGRMMYDKYKALFEEWMR